MKVHLIGIAGTGMGGLARLLKESGHEVRGSDTGIYPPMSDQLAEAGIEVFTGYSPDNLAWGPEAVVVGNVCRADHPEVQAAQAAGLTLESFPSMLARALLPERRSLVVAGTHGKTTTTSLVAWLLRHGGQDPSFLVGGVPLNFGAGAHLGAGGAIVLEGDEYNTAFFDQRSKFLHYRPFRAILTSVEHDHVDIFERFEDMREAFGAFIESIDPSGDLIVHLDDAEAMGLATRAKCGVITYRVLGAHDDPSGATYGARIVERATRRTIFEFFERGASLGEFSTQLIGRHNLSNVVAALAMARQEGLTPEQLREGVLRFRGVKRRQEWLGMAAGVRVIADFAHHPTAVQATVKALRKRYPDNNLHVCFEPRSSSSRRKAFGEAYARSFDAASCVYIGPVYRPEKVPTGDMLDVQALARDVQARGIKARAFDDVETLAQTVLEDAVPGDTVALLSSGSFDGLGQRLLFGFGDPVTFAAPQDAATIADLLEGYGLPPLNPSDDVETLVIRSPDGVVGCVNLLVTGHSSFLFGLAVAPQRRGQGLGWVLGDIVLRRARTLDSRRCYLITNTATDFFAGKLGFSQADPSNVDPEIQESANFRASASLPGAVCMVLEISPDRP